MLAHLLTTFLAVLALDTSEAMRSGAMAQYLNQHYGAHHGQ
jgi:hypothetical protein